MTSLCNKFVRKCVKNKITQNLFNKWLLKLESNIIDWNKSKHVYSPRSKQMKSNQIVWKNCFMTTIFMTTTFKNYNFILIYTANARDAVQSISKWETRLYRIYYQCKTALWERFQATPIKHEHIKFHQNILFCSLPNIFQHEVRRSHDEMKQD